MDCSGSMRPSTEKIRAIVCNAPAVTVAGYCGDGRSGDLCILARDGHMTDLDKWVRDSGNVIDGPALKWLSRQVRPLWWVSDGGVTGINDQSSVSLTREVALFLSSNRHIRVARNFSEAIKVFSQKKRR